MGRLLGLALVLACLGWSGGEWERGREATLLCAGDVMLGRRVGEACRQRGAAYPLQEVAPLLRAADVSFGNLEAQFTTRGQSLWMINPLKADPALAAELHRAGFDVLGLANNHAGDHGRAGLRESLKTVRRAGLVPVGADLTREAAARGQVVAARGVRVGFLAFSDFPQANFIPDPDREAVLQLSPEALEETIPALARRCDVVVVSLHWGREWVRRTSDYQRRLARRAVDLGAKVVVGHHSHVVGEVGRYRGAVIAYSLGNLVFDELEKPCDGALLRVRLRGQSVEGYELVPMRVEAGQAKLAGERHVLRTGES